jgi:hypothetical protein
VKITVGRKPKRVPRQFDRIARKRDRQHAARFDQPRIAVRSLLARAAAIDKRRRYSALGEVDGDRYANHPGAEDEYFPLWQDWTFPRFSVL